MEKERGKDAKDYKSGTTEVGKLSETTVQIDQKPCHLCCPEHVESIMHKITFSFYVPVITICLKLGLVGMGKVQHGIVFCFFFWGKMPCIVLCSQ